MKVWKVYFEIHWSAIEIELCVQLQYRNFHSIHININININIESGFVLFLFRYILKSNCNESVS